MTARALPVLMFHHVESVPAGELVPPPVHADSYLDRRRFAALLDSLAARGCTTLTLADAAAQRRDRRPLPHRAVVLTFDDGCTCFRDHAAPELAARGMTATLFAVSGELGGTNAWDRAPEGAAAAALAAITAGASDATPASGRGERREDLLDAAGLRDLAAAGFEIGSHGRTHRDLTACAAADLAAEVAGSRADLEAALGRPVTTFCYPYGRLDPAARAAVANAGYLAAAAIHGVSAAAPAGDPADLLAVPRLPINPADSPFELRLKSSGAYFWWTRLPRLGLLRALRRPAAWRTGATGTR